MKNKIYFLRHSDPDRTAALEPHLFPLSELGHRQAHELVPVIDSLKLDLIYSSPFTRAKQTIEPFLKQSGMEMIIDERIQGRVLGDATRNDLFNSLFKRSFEDLDFTLEGSESGNDCIRRVQSLIDHVHESHIDKNILFVFHSNPIAFYLSSLDSSVDYEWFRRMPCPVLYEIQVDGFEEVFRL